LNKLADLSCEQRSEDANLIVQLQADVAELKAELGACQTDAHLWLDLQEQIDHAPITDVNGIKIDNREGE